MKILTAGAAVVAAAAVRFVLLGAWPVAIFAVFDIALLGGALMAFHRRPPATEQLSLCDGDLVLRRADGSAIVLPAYWVRLEMVERPPIDLTLWLRFREQRYPLAACLGLTGRREVGSAVDQAMRAWRA